MQSNLPTKFIGKLNKDFSEKLVQQILDSFSKPSVVSFRVNTLKTSTPTLKTGLEKQGFKLENIAWYEDAFLLKSRTQKELTATEEFKNGLIYIQNLSSMLPVLVLDPQPEDKILDIAASPGSKTTQLATLIKNQGEIIANDISRQRLFKLSQNLKEQSVTNVKVTNFPGQKIWEKYPEYFDKVLVDAPCSMEGRFKTYDTKSFDHWTPKKVKILSQTQKYILRSALSATKVSGIIVYSTCTLSPEENEEVIEWLLEKEKGNVVLEDLPKGCPIDKPLEKYSNVQKAGRIYPSENLEGFFIAKLRKIHSNLNS